MRDNFPPTPPQISIEFERIQHYTLKKIGLGTPPPPPLDGANICNMVIEETTGGKVGVAISVTLYNSTDYTMLLGSKYAHKIRPQFVKLSMSICTEISKA